MQIHELTQPRKPRLDEINMVGPGGLASEIGSAIRNPKQALGFTKDGKFSPGLAQQQADQSEYARTATKAAGKIQSQLTPPTLDSALAKLKANAGAQQWINNIVANWPAEAGAIIGDIQAKFPSKPSTPPTATPTTATATKTAAPATATKTATATPAAQSVTLGGKKLDPKNPNDAQVLAAINKQGIKEAPEYTTPGGIVVPGGAKTAAQTNTQPNTQTNTQTNTQAYADKFRSWVNRQLKTTNLATLENNPEVKAKLESLLQKIVAAKDDVDGVQSKLVHDFFSIAVAANHVVQASNPQAQSNTPINRPATTSQGNVDTGLTDTQVYFLRLAAGKAGGPAPRPTGNEFYDSLIQQIRGG